LPHCFSDIFAAIISADIFISCHFRQLIFDASLRLIFADVLLSLPILMPLLPLSDEAFDYFAVAIFHDTLSEFSLIFSAIFSLLPAFVAFRRCRLF